MGMGRYILRRTTLSKVLLILVMTLSVISLACAAAPLPPLMSRSFPDRGTYRPDNRPYIQPLQNHAAEKSWSVGITDDLSSRDEVAFWIGKWSSEDGLTRLRIAGERSFDYRVEVDSIIRASGLPWELFTIPVVESNWRINAVSSSGATGPWQFLEASGRGRKLVIDAWRDDRRDVWRSTEAAMSELAFYDRLFSDWLIAAASYNAGPTRIRRLKEEGNYNSFWEMLDAGIIPAETVNYVPQLIAVAWVSSHAGSLGLPINWDSPMEWTRIASTRSIHLDDLARVTGLSAARIYTAHQELNHPITPPPTLPYLLKVPENKAEEVSTWLEGLEEDGAPERFWRYTVRSGDTLSELADRYGISLSVLLSYNGHVRSGILRIGERLYLPGSDEIPQGADPDNLPVWTGRHEVGTGDSFWSIARQYGVSPELLAEVNHRSMNGVLLAGSVLKVPGRTGGKL